MQPHEPDLKELEQGIPENVESVVGRMTKI